MGLVRDKSRGEALFAGGGTGWEEEQFLLARTRIVANDLPSIAVAEPLHLGFDLF